MAPTNRLYNKIHTDYIIRDTEKLAPCLHDLIWSDECKENDQHRKVIHIRS